MGKIWPSHILWNGKSIYAVHKWLELILSLSGDSPTLKVIATLGAIAISTSDDDLFEAVSSELASMPPHKRAEDRSDLAGLVLSTNSIIHGEVDAATTSLAISLQSDPWNTDIRARLARLFISTGQPEEATNVLLMDMRDTEAAVVGLRGVGRLMNADPEGFGEVQRAVRARPWAKEGWEELGWARGIKAEAGIMEATNGAVDDGKEEE